MFILPDAHRAAGRITAGKHVLIVLKIEFIFFFASFRERSFQLQNLPTFSLP